MINAKRIHVIPKNLVFKFFISKKGIKGKRKGRLDIV